MGLCSNQHLVFGGSDGGMDCRYLPCVSLKDDVMSNFLAQREGFHEC